MRSKDDMRPMADHQNEKTLPELRDRMQDQSASAAIQKGPEMAEDQREAAADVAADRGRDPGDEDAPDRPMTADEKRHEDDMAQHRKTQQRTGEERSRLEEFQRMASNPNVEALKTFLVSPMDADAPPFHFSSTDSAVPVVAETAEQARRMVIAEKGDMWADEKTSIVREFRPQGPMILNDAAWGSMQPRHLRASQDRK